MVNLVKEGFCANSKPDTQIYIGDMIVESLEEQDHPDYLRQVFGVLLQYVLKLKPVKCSFGVTFEKFIGYLLMKRGIEADPK